MLNSSRRNLLYLVHRVPYPPDKGDRIRSFHLLRHLAGRATVHLACLADEPVTAETRAQLQNYCGRLAILPVGGWRRWLRALASLACGRTITEGAFQSPALVATLRDWAREVRFDALLAFSSSMVPYLRLPEFQDVPAVVDLVDVDSQKWLDYAAASRGPRSWLYGTEGRRLRRLEQDLPTWSRAVTLVTEAEADFYSGFCAAGSVHAVANGVDLDYFQPAPPATGSRCVFTGALDYRANVDGLTWFCHEVWPDVHRRYPAARFSLVGRKPVPAVQRLAQLPGVELVGQVPDVRPYLADAAVAVIPLRIARGVQNKVLEALAMGKATVASLPALEGLGAEPGVDLLTASTPREWAEAIGSLLEAPALRQRIGQAGRAYVEASHRWEHCLEPFDTLLGLQGESTSLARTGDGSSASRPLPPPARARS